MARWAILFAALLLFVSGCGESTPGSLTEQGLKAQRSGNYDSAIAICTQAIDENPQNAEAYLYRGRAYQFRNAMGDPQRAVADFSEAIRLAPEVADAYYSRAIVYRDLGRVELADADDKKARANDGQLQEVYRRLPDPAPTTVAETPPQELADEVSPDDEAATDEFAPLASGDLDEILPRSPFEQRRLYNQLKERFEPGSGEESPIERHNRLSREALEQGGDDSWESWGELVPVTPRPPQSTPFEPRMSEESKTVEQAPMRPVPTSPFLPRLPDGLSAEANPPPQTYRSVQSPFGQRAPSPTGFGVQPANPFGQQTPRAVPRSVGQQPPIDNRFSNPAVRPSNPREYVP